MKNPLAPKFNLRICKSGYVKICLTLVLGLASITAIAEEVDQRQAIKLNAEQRAHVLGEMRKLLSGTQAILAALSVDDMTAVAQQARALGVNMGHKAENNLHDVLPPTFMQLGTSVHQDFDRIATEAESLKDPKHTLRQLSTTMNTCAACHDAYQLQSAQVKRKP